MDGRGAASGWATMLRALYVCVLLMHPPAFRRRFLAEMLCVYDEATASTRGLALILDAIVSLARQWVLRAGSWKAGVAVAGACLQVMAGGLIWAALRYSNRWHARVSPPDAALEELMRLIVVSTGAVILLVTLAALWMRGFLQARSRGRSLGR
jgi:hypothetical protein